MFSSSNVDPDTRRLSPIIFQILLALADREKHGYAIMQEVRRNSDAAISLGPGALYTNIKRLLRSNLIEEVDERPDPENDDQRRRYYRLTEAGREAAIAETNRYQAIVDLARSKRLIKAGLES